MDTTGTGKGYTPCKVLTLGDSGVGKTCLLVRFSDDTFYQSYVSTIGCDFRIRSMKVGEETVKLQIWDTAGQERFRAISTSYYRSTDIMIVCFDITNRSSFDNVDNWIKTVREVPDVHPKAFFLIGCKTDLGDKRQVTTEEGLQKAKTLDMIYFETSAKQNHQVLPLFERVAEEFIAHPDAKLEKTTKNPVLTSTEEKKIMGCC